jgi:hypothetical protein
MRTRSKTSFTPFFLFALLLSILDGAITYTPAHAAGVLFAKPVFSGNGNCSSWADACSLQTAISSASAGDQIWVQAGIHKPHASYRFASFILKNGVEIYGGFDGTETQLNQRNFVASVTILSGDLAGNDIGFFYNDENSFQVVVGSNTDSSAILDGFTIRGGNANGGFGPISGGGLYNNVGNPTLRNLTFSGNSASSYGGGMWNYNSSPTLSNVTFSGNSANTSGGGMINLSSSPALMNVTFSDNSASLGGGGMHNTNSSNPTLTNVTFLRNSASSYGGGMTNFRSSNPTLTNVTFSDNSAVNIGGGLYNYASSPALTNVTFSDNSADSGGGGMFNNNSSNPTLTNVTFSGNSASVSSGGGGGMYNTNSSNPTLTNVTFSGNLALSGGGIFNINSSPTLINTLIANSLSGGDCINNSSTLNALSSNNLIKDASNVCGMVNGVDGNILGVDPKLGTLANNGGFTQTHALLADSPAIDKGTNANCPETDQRGVTRPQGKLCDIGASEFRTFTISGNAGTAGVTLSSTEGTLETVLSQSTGVYSLSVPNSWNGTVIPSHPCFTFKPLSKSYTNVSADQTNQDYIATFDTAADCANINVKIGDTSIGTNGVPSQGSLRVSYAGIDNGPVNVTSTNDKPIIVSQRVLSKNGRYISHFSELMGLPQHLVSKNYVFPAYDNSNFDSQLRFANVSDSTAIVRLYIGRQEMTSGCSPSNSPYTLLPSAGLRVSCPEVNDGPVKIVSDQNIVASLRVLYNNGNAVISFSEMMGLPESQWNNTYWMPWYNNFNLDTQIRIGNIGKTRTQVTVTVGGVIQRTVILAPDTHIRVSIPDLNSGPVKITSSGGVPIVASQRVAHDDGTKWINFSEMMGLPATQVWTSYLFPRYNSVGLDSQLRFANVDDTQTATVHVYIGGVEMQNSPFTLLPGESIRQSFPGIDNGPVEILSDQNIVASLRVLVNNRGAGLAFSELMGLPASHVETSYFLPWYNSLYLDTQLRFGVPWFGIP